MSVWYGEGEAADNMDAAVARATTWKDLPEHLLEAIGEHLYGADFLAARSVSSTWRRALSPVTRTIKVHLHHPRSDPQRQLRAVPGAFPRACRLAVFVDGNTRNGEADIRGACIAALQGMAETNTRTLAPPATNMGVQHGHDTIVRSRGSGGDGGAGPGPPTPAAGAGLGSGGRTSASAMDGSSGSFPSPRAPFSGSAGGCEGAGLAIGAAASDALQWQSLSLTVGCSVLPLNRDQPDNTTRVVRTGRNWVGRQLASALSASRPALAALRHLTSLELTADPHVLAAALRAMQQTTTSALQAPGAGTTAPTVPVQLHAQAMPIVALTSGDGSTAPAQTAAPLAGLTCLSFSRSEDGCRSGLGGGGGWRSETGEGQLLVAALAPLTGLTGLRQLSLHAALTGLPPGLSRLTALTCLELTHSGPGLAGAGGRRAARGGRGPAEQAEVEAVEAGLQALTSLQCLKLRYVVLSNPWVLTALTTLTAIDLTLRGLAAAAADEGSEDGEEADEGGREEEEDGSEEEEVPHVLHGGYEMEGEAEGGDGFGVLANGEAEAEEQPGGSAQGGAAPMDSAPGFILGGGVGGGSGQGAIPIPPDVGRAAGGFGAGGVYDFDLEFMDASSEEGSEEVGRIERGEDVPAAAAEVIPGLVEVEEEGSGGGGATTGGVPLGGQDVQHAALEAGAAAGVAGDAEGFGEMPAVAGDEGVAAGDWPMAGPQVADGVEAGPQDQQAVAEGGDANAGAELSDDDDPLAAEVEAATARHDAAVSEELWRLMAALPEGLRALNVNAWHESPLDDERLDELAKISLPLSQSPSQPHQFASLSPACAAAEAAAGSTSPRSAAAGRAEARVYDLRPPPLSGLTSLGLLLQPSSARHLAALSHLTDLRDLTLVVAPKQGTIARQPPPAAVAIQLDDLDAEYGEATEEGRSEQLATATSVGKTTAAPSGTVVPPKDEKLQRAAGARGNSSGDAGPSPMCALSALTSLERLRVYDDPGVLHMDGEAAALLAASWPRMYDIYLLGSLSLHTTVTTLRPFTCLAHLDLFSQDAGMPYRVQLPTLPRSLRALGVQNAVLEGAAWAGELQSVLAGLSLYATVHWPPRANGGIDMYDWIAGCSRLARLTIEYDMQTFAAMMRRPPAPAHPPAVATAPFAGSSAAAATVTSSLVTTTAPLAISPAAHTPLRSLRALRALSSLGVFFADSHLEHLATVLDQRLVNDLAALASLEELEIWNVYGSDWNWPKTDLSPLTCLRRLRSLKMEALPPAMAFKLRRLMQNGLPYCKLRLVADNEMQPVSGPLQAVIPWGLGGGGW